MTVDKRTPHTDALDTLGYVIDETAKRDAIHVAVEPAYAAQMLRPGQHVGFVDGKASTKAEKLVGIVDPFINGMIEKGQRFWLLLYPRTITSLRHVWSHPDFEDVQHDDAMSCMEETLIKKVQSEKWLRDFIDDSGCPSYEYVIAAALDFDTNDWSDGLHFDGQDAHGSIPPEFWDHVEVVTGRPIPDKHRKEYFSCSC